MKDKIMTTKSPTTEREQIPLKSIVPFLLITFGLTWGIVALYLLFSEQMNRVFGALSDYGISLSRPLWLLASVWAFGALVYGGVFYIHCHAWNDRRYWRCFTENPADPGKI